jgi:hypothetical protein
LSVFADYRDIEDETLLTLYLERRVLEYTSLTDERFLRIILTFTAGQMRWLALNGVVGLALLWVFNQSGMDSQWVVFSTHSVGYVLLAVVLIIMILVFGGVVLVWSHLIDFLKEILVRYPEVQEEISENKVLEQVLIRYAGHNVIR